MQDRDTELWKNEACEQKGIICIDKAGYGP